MARSFCGMRVVERMTIGEPVCWKIFHAGSIFPALLMTTRRGSGGRPRWTREARSFSLESRIDMVSAATVPRPARMASCCARISPMRALSAGDVNCEGVRFFVLILPSAVMAKWAWIFGLMPRADDRPRYCVRRVFRDRRRIFPSRQRRHARSSGRPNRWHRR